MIEKALRKELQPLVNRRRHLSLAWRLSVYWLIAGLLGVALLGANWLWGWSSPLAIGALCIAAVLATIWAIYRSRRLRPDYRAIARNIERQNPDLKALLLAAIEQRPEGPGSRLGYLQRQVLKQALVHATDHNWLKSISTTQLVLADLGRIAALLFLLVILSQVVPATSWVAKRDGGVLAERGYQVTVTPGDTTVELGAPVVILARFETRIPSKAGLLFGAPGREPEQMTLTRSLDDPVFGGIIQDVTSELLYHVEYAGKRTRDYTISVYQCPRLIRADARIVYPSYTELAEKVVKDTRQISVVEGSQITLTFTLNKPVTTARLAPRTGIALGLAVDSADPNVLIASLTALKSQRYELRMADAQGRSNKVPPRFAIDVHQNLPPELTPVFPNRDVVVSPLEELALEAKVSDDYGVTGYGLTYTLAGTPSQDVTLGRRVTSSEGPQIQYLLALEQLNAEPDQVLTYSFWADDVGPDGKPRRTASDMYFAEVRPFEEIFRESQSFQDQRNQDQRERQGGQQQDRQGEQLARLQKQIISATWNIKQQGDRSGGLEDSREDLDVVRQSQADALEQARTASTQAEDPSAIQSLQAATKHMETSLSHLTKATKSASTAELTPALGAEQSAYQELLKLRQREHQIALGRSSDRANNAGSARSDQQLEQLELKQQQNRYETQRLARSQEQTTQREDLQVLNRLRDLARRQNEVSDKLREAQAALRQAQNEQQRQEALRELRRLRDEQLEALRDVDELQQRMESPQNRQRMADAREQLNDSRSRIRQSAQELEQGMVSRAITSATRAQRQLEQMRDDFRRRASSRFAEEMRNMRDEAQQLDQRQREIAEEIGQQMESRQRTLAGSDGNRELADRIGRQRESMEELIDQMKDVSEQAETSEPLLSRKLYDTLRRASTENVDRALETTGELLKRNFLPQAREIERRAGDGIEEIRKGVEEAAQNVLGDEAESLRLAREQLDELIRQVNDEAARAGREGQPSLSDPNEPMGAAEDGRRQADARSGTGNRLGDRPSADQPRDAAESQRPQQVQQPGGPRDGVRPPGAERGGARADAGGRADPTGRGGNPRSIRPWDEIDPNGPLTGDAYRQWSDRLRDVEEMLTERSLRDEVARVRDQARAMRTELTRHGKEPQWDLVGARIINPLTELRQQISDKLAQLQSDGALVPIDRDPVPDRFAEVVRTYFENLGEDDR